MKFFDPPTRLRPWDLAWYTLRWSSLTFWKKVLAIALVISLLSSIVPI